MNDQLQLLLVAFLGSGSVTAIFQYIRDRKKPKIEYSESVTRTLTEFNTLLENKVKNLQEENDGLRIRVRTLEDRVATLEREGR